MRGKFLHHRNSTCSGVLYGIFLLVSYTAAPSGAAAQMVWNGGSLTFTKASAANADLPANQDRITGNVWITRRNTEGLLNIHNETSYIHKAGTVRSSPSDTEWSFGTIGNYATLTYMDWESWFNMAPNNILNANAVVHLISENIYVGIRFLSWSQGGGGGGGFSYTRTTQALLPVKLVSFSAKLKDRKVCLDWVTAQEQNSGSFQVERSTDGKNFTPVSAITASGNSSMLQSYGYTDINPFAGINYYRLKQLDRDGKYTYSNIVALHFTDKKNSIILNRYDGIVYITNNNSDNAMQVLLFSSSGILLKKQNYLSNAAQLPVKEFPQGIYFIKVLTGRDVFSGKIFKP